MLGAHRRLALETSGDAGGGGGCQHSARKCAHAPEREVGALLQAGLSKQGHRERLGIEVATVKNHVHNLLEKLDVHRRGQAVARLQGSSQARRSTPVP